MTEGTVKFFNDMKQFGFINGDDGKDYYVHVSGLKEGATIKEGDKVSFKAVEGERGPKAEEVEKIGEKSAEAPKEEKAEKAPKEEKSEEKPAEEE